MNGKFPLFANRARALVDIRGKTNRAIWWIGLLSFAMAALLAYYIYDHGLSRWLRKPDLSATLWAAVIVIVAFSVVTLLSIRRCNEMGCKPKWLWIALVIPVIPIWILILGSVPPDGMRAVTRKRVVAGSFGIGIAVLALVAVPNLAFLLQESDPSSPSQEKPGSASRSTTFDCANLWNGSVVEVNRAIKDRLHDASSFEHIETSYSSESEGKWAVAVRYRARNSLGVLVQEGALAVVDSNCRVNSIAGLG